MGLIHNELEKINCDSFILSKNLSRRASHSQAMAVFRDHGRTAVRPYEALSVDSVCAGHLLRLYICEVGETRLGQVSHLRQCGQDLLSRIGWDDHGRGTQGFS